MKVDGSDPLSRLRGMLDRIHQQDDVSASRDSKTSAAQASQGTSGDSVTMSSRAQELAALREAIDSSPEVRREMVEKLREEISSGLYKVDGTRIAEALLDEFKPS
jgi:flagellar biosynthesis anti-sigma factor FlgM